MLCISQLADQSFGFEGCYRCGAPEDSLEESIHPEDAGLHEAEEVLWCRHCLGRVNEDYDLWRSNKALWCLLDERPNDEVENALFSDTEIPGSVY